MAKNKRELQAELEAANKRIAELSQSNQNANSNINNEEPPSWLKTLLEAQSESQRQMQLESQRQMQQIIERFSQQQLAQSANSERSESREQTIDVNNANNEARRTKVDAQKPSTLQVGISLAEFAKWRKSYNDYATVSLATELPLSSQLGLLRGFFSVEMREAVEHVLLIPDDTTLKPDEVLDKIKNYIRSQRNIALDCVAFEERKQAAGENFDSFLIAIKTLARDADLCNECLNRRLVTKIMSGIYDKETRTKLLAMSPLPDLQTVTDLCRSEESAKLDDARISRQLNERRAYQSKFRRNFSKSKERTKTPCTKCGKKTCPPKGQTHCPAKDTECLICRKKGHFTSVCFHNKPGFNRREETKKKLTGQIKRRCNANANFANSAEPKITVNLFSLKHRNPLGSTEATPDTGAEASLVGVNIIQRLGIDLANLMPPNQDTLSAVNRQTVTCVGTFPCIIEYCGRFVEETIYVCPEVKDFLLAWYVCQQVNILPDTYPQPINSSKTPRKLASILKAENTRFIISENPTEAEISQIENKSIKSYSDVFSEDTTLREMNSKPMKISLKDDAVPFALPVPRQIPLAFRRMVKTELDQLVQARVIAPVTEATDWVHPMVVVQKPNGGIRLCIDLQKLNKYVRRPYHPSKSPAEAISNISSSSKFFSTLDGTKGYWQVPLEKESQDFTTFITPFGRFKFLRAPMGLASSQDEYCARGDKALQGIEKVEKVVDDILIQGETAQEHLNTVVVAVLNRCREHGITLNPKKVQLLQSAVRYVGYIVSSDGIKADPTKIEAISEFPAPTNITELRSFMGMANQLGGFTHLLSEAAGPLRDLLKPKNAFLWSPQHEEAFTKTKDILCSPHILVAFDPNLETMLQTDASRLKGLGFALLQKHQETWKLVQAGSRFITETEANYAMVELELLTVVWAMRKCRIYLQGLPNFELIVDHKPLESILNTQTLDMVDNPRIQRLKEKLSAFIFHTTWRKGKDHVIPDALSRAPCRDPEPEDIINVDTTRMICKNVSTILRGKDPEVTKETFIDPMLEDLKESTQQDEAAQQLITAIKSNFSKGNEYPLAQPFKKLKDQLTFEDGLILLNSHRIVVPVQKRKEILTKLHASHQGIERTKQRARQIVYWPGINSDIKNTVEACTKCQEHQPSLQQEPLQRDPLPSRPFEDVSADLFYYAGKTYLVYVDRLSGWIKLNEFSHDPSSHQIISTIRKFFVDTGVPVRIRTDGGPQFTSSKFQQFLKKWGVTSTISTPHYPQSNGHAEAAVKAMKHLVAKTAEHGSLDCDEFSSGLIEWVNTPKAHGLSPAEILYGAPLRSIVPAKLKYFKEDWQNKFDKWDAALSNLQVAAETEYNKRAKHLNPLKIGQHVRIQDHITKKWLRSGLIIGVGRNRDYHIKLSTGRVCWRNRRFIRPLPTEGGDPKEEMMTSDERHVHFEDEVFPPSPTSRRSVRQKRFPNHLRDFV